MEWLEAVLGWLEAVLGSPYFDQVAAAATAIGVVGAPAAWAIKRWWNGRQIKKTVAKGLCAELEDTVRALGETSRHRQLEKTIIDPESMSAIKTCKKIHCTLTFLNHDAYDSFLYSGHLMALDAGLVQEVQNVYQLVKYHNKYLKHLMPLLDRESETGEVNLTGTSTYYNILDKYESNLLETIPPLKKSLLKLASFWSRPSG